MTRAVSSANADLQAGALPLSKPAFAVALAFVAFQIASVVVGPLSSTGLRAIHVGFLLLLTFALLPPARRQWLGWSIGAIGFAIGAYQWAFEAELLERAGSLHRVDLAIGVLSVVLVFEATRRTLGFALPLVCALFVAYALLGQALPGVLRHPGYDLTQVISQLAFGTEGIYSTPIYVSATYIFLFILFGSLLEHAGVLSMFDDIALGVFGRAPGGPGKACVASSALMGTVSGSGVANVVASAPQLIPMMKRCGYRADFAGGVEAGSSVGGQLMPPVMGAVAFIMAEGLDVPYVEVCKAALLPATLYFIACFWMVRLEANRQGLRGLSADECPSAARALAQGWHLLLPLMVLVLLLAGGFTPLESGLAALALTAILVLGVALLQPMRGKVRRALVWIVLGIACAAALEHGVGAFVAIVAFLAVIAVLVRGGRQALQVLVHALADGARTALPVGTACAQVGVIVGVLSLTGAASHFVEPVVAIGQNSLFAALLVTMLTCIVVGMGISTIPNYIIASAIAAPALLQLGVPLLVSHMFIFYFGILADLTPPVALAAFAAAPYAGASGTKISAQAVRIALAGFVIPFMAVYSPALLLQAGNWLDVAYITVKALIAIALWGIAAVGYWRGPVNGFERIFAFVAAAFLVSAVPLTDEIGLLLSVLFVIWHRARMRALRKRGGVAPSS